MEAIRDMQIELVPVAYIEEGKNYREVNDAGIQELAASIAVHGVLNPLVVRSTGESYRVIAGHRRLRAAKLAGLETIPCTVLLKDGTQMDAEVQLVENMHRQDAHPMEEARAIQALAKLTKQKDVNALGERLGKSGQYVWDRLRLLDLIEAAQKHFMDGHIQLGHAVVLSRLSTKDQKRALDALFEDENLVLAPGEEGKKIFGMKARSVGELKGWVDEHVRFDVEAPDNPVLFPKTAENVDTAKQKAVKVVYITHEHYIAQEARGNDKVYFPRSWKAVGNKSCEHEVLGVVYVGAGRGESFNVCVAKEKCTTHWGKEIAEKKRTAKKHGTLDGNAKEREKQRQQAKEAKREAENLLRNRYKVAAPALLKAFAAAVKKAPCGSTGALAEIILGQRNVSKTTLMSRGRTAEDFIRWLAGDVIFSTVNNSYWAPDDLPALGKQLGVNVAAILEAEAPKPKPKAVLKKKAAAKKTPARKK